MRAAARQHDVVALSQLELSKEAVYRRVRTGRLHRLYDGVYAVGTPNITQKGRWKAATLACGEGAALSHRSAIALHGLRPGNGPRWPDVSAPRGRHQQPGLKLHRPRELPPEEIVIVDSIPVTSIRRAILDYAACASINQVRLALEKADRNELIDRADVEWMIGHTKGRRGGKQLRVLLGEYVEPPMTRSELENAFLAAIREAGIPEPQTNVLVEGFDVDYWWPDARLVVELDGFEFHRGRGKFDGDRREDRTLRLARIEILRYTDPDLKTAAAQASTAREVATMRSRGISRACEAA